MPDKDVDLFVIGAGSGGVRAARIAATHGARVAIAEDYRIGGTCVIRGCVPKKLMVFASRFADAFEDARGFGWRFDEPSFSWPDLIAAKDHEIQRLSEIYERNLRASHVRIHHARATLGAAHEVLLSDGTRVHAERVLISTGGWPVMPAIPGIEYAISSNEVFDLPALPESIAIVGAGYIALEFASLLQRLGSRVTVVHRGEKLLRGFDEDLRDGTAEVLAEAGIELRFCAEIAAIDRAGDLRRVRFKDGSEESFAQVMFASGRAPNVRGLGLEQHGVMFDTHGAIRVDAFSQTTTPWIYAVGDVTNRLNLTPIAIREGHALADTLFGNKPTTVDHKDVPTAVFITPEIGTVGLTEEQARCRGGEIDIYKTAFKPMKAALSGRKDRVLMKLVVDAASDRVLGAHILGEEAGEMIQMLGIAIKLGATKADFDATVAVHPTIAEEIVTMRTRWTPPVDSSAMHPHAGKGENPVPDLVAGVAAQPPAEIEAELMAEASEPAIQSAVSLAGEEHLLEILEAEEAGETAERKPE